MFLYFLWLILIITLSSYLPIFTNLSIHLHKINHTNSQLLFYHNELKNNNFDGWFNSNVIDKTYLEVALLNDNDSFEVVKTERLKKDWSRENNANNIVIQKKWGDKYPIFSLNIPVIFKLNNRYEKSIKKYYPKCCLQILLQNALIEYHDGEFKNIFHKYISNVDLITLDVLKIGYNPDFIQ